MQADTTKWSLVSLTPWSASMTLGLLIALWTVLILVCWRYWKTPKTRYLIALRLGMTTLLSALLVQPALQIQKLHTIRDTLAIIVDNSQSMQFDDQTTLSRHERFKNWFQQHQDDFEKIQQQHQLIWFDLNQATTLENIASSTYHVQKTDLLAALENAQNSLSDRIIGAYLLISDGADNAELPLLENERLSEQAKRRLAAFSSPINTLSVFTQRHQPVADLAIVDVHADAFAFVHNTFTVDVSLRVQGVQQDKQTYTTDVFLKDDTRTLTAQRAIFDEQGKAQVTFQLKPTQVGDFIYRVEIPAIQGEVNTDNNHYDFLVQVIRDKIRVLQVSGRPSWDERFLRQYLKENPNTDLVSFFILRTPSDDISIPESELSLIPFPVNKLFTSELKNFDVIIFQNFDFRPYHMAQYLPNIKDAVQSGLGFVMLGGNESFGSGGYAETSIAQLLPIRVGPQDFLSTTVEPQLTTAGQHHPVLQIEQGGKSRANILMHTPQWTSLNKSLGLTKDATALVTAKNIQTSEHEPIPLIAVKEFGQGRSLSIATDTLWRWHFPPSMASDFSNHAYHSFWSSALRWLVRDPDHAHIRIVLAKSKFDTEEPVEARLTLLGQDYLPVPNAAVEVTLQKENQVPTTQLHTTDTQGNIHLQFTDLKKGRYQLSAEEKSHKIYHGKSAFIVDTLNPETRELSPNTHTLDAIAQKTAGYHGFLENDSLSKLRWSQAHVEQVDAHKNIVLWDNGFMLTVLVLLWALEWYLRRKHGLV